MLWMPSHLFRRMSFWWLHLSLEFVAYTIDRVPGVTAEDGRLYKDNSISTYYNFAIQRQKCKEKSLDEQERRAAFIFTGTVRDVQPDDEATAAAAGHQRAQVEVKRIIKGDSTIIRKLPEVYVESKYPPVRHRVVTVRGLGSRNFCISHVRKHDTWIFFTNFIPPNRLVLNSSLLRLSLNNIAQTELAVIGSKDKNHVSTDIEEIESCEQRFCPYNGECIVNKETKSVECKCIEACVDVNAFVCGSDGNTYANECQLRIASCSQQKRIRVQWNGSCDVYDPCRSMTCNFGSRCIPSSPSGPSLSSPVCQCPERCEDFGVEDNELEVCSEDSDQFRSLCDLRKTSCQEQRNVSVKHFGRCDPCFEVRCSFHGQCVVDSLGRPKCACLSNCSENFRPVCGSDGQMYVNKCEMDLTSCRKEKPITIASNKEACVDPCAAVQCKYGSRCQNGKCSCPKYCPMGEDPVCASNHDTYQNECAMLSSACYQEISLVALHAGECEEMSGFEGFCDEDNCRFDGVCQSKEDNNSAKCVCNFDCTAIRHVICGSDGKTYSNECYMRYISCQKQTAITRKSMGACQDLVEEEEICDGNDVLLNDASGLEYDCLSGQDVCPTGSYCHVLNDTARCCNGSMNEPTQFCAESKYGCCPDGIMPALGSFREGCVVTHCRCNAVGSYGKDCDPFTGQCACKKGVGGLRCDRCESNYWGLPKIAKGNEGCLSCGCNIYGAIREDCDQMTGECVCRPFVFGPKCDMCAIDGSAITGSGCTENETESKEEMFSSSSSSSRSSHVSERSSSTYLLTTTKPVDVDYVIPSFSGSSYIQLKQLEHGNSDMSVEMEFRPLSTEGLLLYTGQNGDGRDFISLSLKNGFVEFRYDLGSGPTVMRTREQVTLKKLHRLAATRHGKDGLLKLDDGPESSAVSPGRLRSLNIGLPLYLGYVPNLTEQIAKNSASNSGFVGCIQMLRVASPKLNREFELAKSISSDIETDMAISECELYSCKTVQCSNGGMCIHEEEADKYTCTCQQNYTGVLCENEVVNIQ